MRLEGVEHNNSRASPDHDVNAANQIRVDPEISFSKESVRDLRKVIIFFNVKCLKKIHVTFYITINVFLRTLDKI